MALNALQMEFDFAVFAKNFAPFAVIYCSICCSLPILPFIDQLLVFSNYEVD
jgi:hypothetical protein